MKKLRKLILVSAVFLSWNAFAQTSAGDKAIVIVDAKTSAPVELATISVNRTRYFAANQRGEFTFKTSYVANNDTLRVSAVGYTSQIYLVRPGNWLPDTVKLVQNVQQLKEVTITKTKQKEVLLGNSRSSIGRQVTNLDWTYALYVPNANNMTGTISELEFCVNNVADGITGPLKVNVYARSANSIFPGKELINDDIVIDNPKKKKVVTVDVSKYHIEIPADGFFIVAQTLSKEYYSSAMVIYKGYAFNKLPGLGLTFNKVTDGSYSVERRESNTWHKAETMNYRFTAKVLADQ